MKNLLLLMEILIANAKDEEKDKELEVVERGLKRLDQEYVDNVIGSVDRVKMFRKRDVSFRVRDSIWIFCRSELAEC
jgi:hypothetical protein